MSEPVSPDAAPPAAEPASSDEPATDSRPIVDSSLTASESSLDVATPHDREMKDAADVQDALE